MLEKLKNLDRRFVFVFILLSVIIPLLFPLNLKMNTTKPVEDIYNYIESLPADSVIMVSFDYSPSTKIELDPAAEAIIRHAFRKRHKVVTLSLWPTGQSMEQNVLKKLEDEFNEQFGAETIRYGVNYVNLGYKPGGSVLLIGLKDGFAQQFPTDASGTNLSDIPLMNRVRDYDSCDLIVSLSAGVPGMREYVIIVSSQFGKKVAAACTAVSAPEMYAFLNSGQLLGLMGGLRGAAEYELLTNYTGDARKGMDAQSVVHVMIVIFILLSNIIYFVGEYKRKQEG